MAPAFRAGWGLPAAAEFASALWDQHAAVAAESKWLQRTVHALAGATRQLAEAEQVFGRALHSIASAAGDIGPGVNRGAQSSSLANAVQALQQQFRHRGDSLLESADQLVSKTVASLCAVDAQLEKENEVMAEALLRSEQRWCDAREKLAEYANAEFSSSFCSCSCSS